MSTILRRVIPAFRNPVRQGLGGLDFDRGAQRISIPSGGIYAIAIASDSEVDLVALCPRGSAEPDDLIVVGVGAPWIGWLDGIDLFAVPVRAAAALSTLSSYGAQSATPTYPKLKLDLYADEPPLALPMYRAPYESSWAATGAAAAVSFAWPVMGRREVSVDWMTDTYAGSGPVTAVAAVVQLHGYAVSAAGVITAITEVPTITDAATGVVGRWRSTPDGYDAARTGRGQWVTAVLTLTPVGTGTYAYYVNAGAR